MKTIELKQFLQSRSACRCDVQWEKQFPREYADNLTVTVTKLALSRAPNTIAYAIKAA